MFFLTPETTKKLIRNKINIESQKGKKYKTALRKRNSNAHNQKLKAYILQSKRPALKS